MYNTSTVSSSSVPLVYDCFGNSTILFCVATVCLRLMDFPLEVAISDLKIYSAKFTSLTKTGKFLPWIGLIQGEQSQCSLQGDRDIVCELKRVSLFFT